MNVNYIARALCYHGQPLQKIWDDERGVEDLRRLNLTQPNYSVYQERQKYFTFQERAKRLKVHQFLARKANDLYDRQLVGNVMEESFLTQKRNCIAPQPPIEFFMNFKDKRKAWAYRMGALKQGDVICATVVKANPSRLMVKPLCTAEPLHFYLADILIKAHIFQDQWGPLPLDKQGIPRQFAANDFIRCEVCSVSADVERLTLGMLGLYNKSPDLKLGLCDLTDFPSYYRKIHNQEHPSALHYEDQLNAALEFENPNYDVLFQLNGLRLDENLTLMSSIKVGFPEADYALELRQKQASQWAFRSVADGIEHFKNGQQVEAFQCLNKALNIDPRNVEGLVARGALYANRGSFLKGLKDFEKALLLNKYHVNARKYMGETLVALGRSYEEENRIPDAIKAYSDCLNLLPQHEQARISLDALQHRPSAPLGSSQISMQQSADLLNIPKTVNPVNLVASSDESSSSSGSDNDSEEHSGKSSRPYFSHDQDKRAVSDSLSANEFKLDDDETMSSVRKLLRDANKHKKSKKKSKKKDKDKKSKKYKSKSNDSISATEAALEMLKKIDYQEAFRLVNSSTSDAQLKAHLENYFKQNERSESPPPPPPPPPVSTTVRKTSSSESYNLLMGPSTSKNAAAAAAHLDDERPPPAPKFHDHQRQEQQKLSFQIKKRPLQMDKFGLLRLVTPLSSHSRSRSRSRSRDRAHSHGRSRSRSPRRRLSRSRSRDRRPYKRRINTRSRSRSGSSQSRSTHSRRRRSRSYTPPRYKGWHRGRGGGPKPRFNYNSRDRRSRSRSLGRGRRTPSPFTGRRTPSPFVPRRTPSPDTRYRRTRSRSISPRRQFPRYQPRGRGRGYTRGRFQNRFPFDGRNKDRRHNSDANVSPPGGGPTIEEVDEMIKEAQKERKQGIIEADKNILKRKDTNTTTEKSA